MFVATSISTENETATKQRAEAIITEAFVVIVPLYTTVPLYCTSNSLFEFWAIFNCTSVF